MSSINKRSTRVVAKKWDGVICGNFVTGVTEKLLSCLKQTFSVFVLLAARSLQMIGLQAFRKLRRQIENLNFDLDPDSIVRNDLKVERIKTMRRRKIEATQIRF